ncbi:unnamed protein product [Tilletia controversa]|uniref:Uncharacterized protein n=3 Tax=Tilletia TaxID=13289 RepID=A0A8X7MPL9_9BASI|nr:hypothetical protein CF328_g6094 [Tilletia controversa]KAE8190716.1 hypothetical protein CF336_g5182 [Tilletia laevis]KAE8254060.1 hypothetical protein A4X03_0g5773 [Tilletia caries]KAE8244043.1 hypothetical protein A4X06_0g6001 [Tilletia controversa]CAD6902539.1 unnamed protein product [Tilletia controversa]
MDTFLTVPMGYAASRSRHVPINHCVNFGTGALSGIGSLTAYDLPSSAASSSPAGCTATHGATEPHNLLKAQREELWSQAFRPSVVKTKDGELQIDTAFSRLLGRIPNMVLGMTPSRVGTGYARGNIIYTEAMRIGVRKLEVSVKEMAVGARVGPLINVKKADKNIGKLWMLIKNEPSMSAGRRSRVFTHEDFIAVESGASTPATKVSHSSSPIGANGVPIFLPGWLARFATPSRGL